MPLPSSVSGCSSRFCGSNESGGPQHWAAPTRNFPNANGLQEENHYTCARDLAIITRAAMAYDDFLTICGTAQAEIPATNLSDARTLDTTNFFLAGSTHPEYAYEGAYGALKPALPLLQAIVWWQPLLGRA